MLLLSSCGGGDGGGGGGSSGTSGGAEQVVATSYTIAWSNLQQLQALVRSGVDTAIVAQGNVVTALWTASPDRVGSTRFTPASGWSGTTIFPSVLNRFSVSRPRLYSDANGNVTAIWTQTTGTEPNGVWTARFEPATGWSPQVKLNSSEINSACSDAAIDSSGVVTAIWLEAAFASNSGTLVARRYVPGTGWTGAETLEASTLAFECRVVANANGEADATWRSLHSTATWSIWWRRHTPGSGWDMPIEVYSTDADLISTALVNDGGSTTLAWTESIQQGLIRVARRNAASSSVVTDVAVNASGVVVIRHLSADSLASVILVWEESTPGVTAHALSAKRRDPNTGVWSESALLTSNYFPATSTTAVAPNGDHWFVFAEPSSGGITPTRARRYRAGIGWESSQLINSSNMSYSVSGTGDQQPDSVVDASGNMTVVWPRRENGNFVLWSQRFEPARGWSAMARVAATGIGDAEELRLAVNSQGRVAAIWRQLDLAAGIRVWLSDLSP